MLRCIALVSSIVPFRSFACELALVLAVDVSGSVDPTEYRIQMDGLSAGLRDGVVMDALVSQQAHVTLIQWSGSGRQRQTLPWTALRQEQDVLEFAQAVEQDPRVWRNFSTAIGEALALSRDVLQDVPQCARKVIDVSGDGVSNEGVLPTSLHAVIRHESITVNAIAIETDSTDLTAYFYENLIMGPQAFVVTAVGFEDYPEQIRRKLQRETTKQVSALEETQMQLLENR
ncbi:DUF1194 domain-containing protein [Ascidiaceihabitans sp.]|uniref:DUF1194 domain-containing protein n=1 Tax=Ascidiaceihabitans sp. TaxID=1872644 RepID=UPI00329717ED